ncbi:MAG: radical SAM protein [Eubacteriales bacterium]
MKEYKSSRYNYIVHANENDIIYNSRTGKMVANTHSDMIYIDELFRNGVKSDNNDPRISALVNDGFLVDASCNEIELVLQKRKEYLNDNGLFLMILPTEQCNFRCIYCYETFSRPKMTIDIVAGIKQFVFENLPRYNKLSVAWFGGEPMLAMDIIDELSEYFLELCSEQRKPYFSTMTTNGSLLTPENWKKLKKNHITGYQISIDGLAETHDSQRIGADGKGTWDSIISNLRFFRDCVKTRTINIAIRSNITKEIYNIKNEYIEFLKNEFGGDKRFHLFFHLAQDWGNIDNDSVRNSFCGADEFYGFLEEVSTFNLSMKIHESFMLPGSRICFAAKKNSFVITADGAVRKCSEHIYEDFNYLFDIRQPKYMDYFNQEYWNFADKKVADECVQCKKLPLCYGLVCPAYRGKITDTCGYDLSDMNKVILSLYKTKMLKLEGM